MADTATLSDTDLALRLARALGWHDVAYGERAPDQCNAPALDVVIVHGRGHMLAWLLTGDGCMAVLGAMRERGWRYMLEGENHWLAADFYREHGNGTTYRRVGQIPLPRAVAEAAYLALTGGRGDDAIGALRAPHE